MAFVNLLSFFLGGSLGFLFFVDGGGPLQLGLFKGKFNACFLGSRISLGRS